MTILDTQDNERAELLKCDRCGVLWIREFHVEGGWIFTEEGPRKWDTQKWQTPDGKLWDSYCFKGQEGMCIEGFWQNTIFKGRTKPDYTYGDYCLSCAEKMTPWVYIMRDIRELNLFVNKLKGAIRERRKNDQDNWST